MDSHEHMLRKGLRTAIENAMTATLTIGEAVDVGVFAAEVYTTAARPPEPMQAFIYVVSWPMPGQPIRQALGFKNKSEARLKAKAEDNAEIFQLEVI